jgi:hypothetical protein
MMNYKIMLYNIREAREQLAEIEKELEDENLSENAFHTKLEQAYHHLNFAWNIRHETTESYREMSDMNFNRWSRVPKQLKPFKIEK